MFEGMVRYGRRKQDRTSLSPIEHYVVSSQGKASSHEERVCGYTAFCNS